MFQVFKVFLTVWGLFVPGRIVPELFVPLSYKMLGINNLASKKFSNPASI